MADNLKKNDGRDRSKVNKNQTWEVAQVAKKEGVKKQEVLDAIKKVGPNRDRVVKEIRKK